MKNLTRWDFSFEHPKKACTVTGFVFASSKSHAYQKIESEKGLDVSEVKSLKQKFTDHRKHDNGWQL